MTAHAKFSPRQIIVNSRFAYLGATVAQSGIQLIAPSLPGMRDALGLDDAQLALVTSLYLLPAALFALPAGVLADRIGRRKVYGWAMILLGVSGIALQFATHSFPLFLAIRFIQGTAFAGLMPLTMTILGDAHSGANLIKAQGRRTVVMHAGDGTLPIIGGLLVGLGWHIPWLGQLLGIPFGIAVLLYMRDPTTLTGAIRRRIRLSDLVTLFRSKAILALQYSGFLRMFLKFSIITFLPLLLIDEREFSPALAGLIIGAASLTGTIPAMFAGRLAPLARPTSFVFLGTLVQGIAMLAMVLSGSVPVIIGASVIYGTADGLAGVFVNSFVSAATDDEQRASFVAATGAIRNAAKFMAPAVLGALTLVITVSTSFLIMAIITLFSAVIAIPLRDLDQRLSDQALT